MFIPQAIRLPLAVPNDTKWLVVRALVSSGWMVTVSVHRALEPGRRTKIDGVAFVSIGNDLRSRLSWSRLVAERADWWLWQCSNQMSGYRQSLM